MTPGARAAENSTRRHLQILAFRRRSDRVDRERLGDETGVLLPRRVVQVAHRRLDVSVAHPLLNAADIGLGDHPRAERVTEIVVVPTSTQP